MQKWLKWRVKVIIDDGRQLVGTLLAFDRFMNVVLSDCQEFRHLKKTKETEDLYKDEEIKKVLGLVVLRGENVCSLVPQSPPTDTKSDDLPPGVGKVLRV